MSNLKIPYRLDHAHYADYYYLRILIALVKSRTNELGTYHTSIFPLDIMVLAHNNKHK